MLIRELFVKNFVTGLDIQNLDECRDKIWTTWIVVNKASNLSFCRSELGLKPEGTS